MKKIAEIYLEIFAEICLENFAFRRGLRRVYGGFTGRLRGGLEVVSSRGYLVSRLYRLEVVSSHLEVVSSRIKVVSSRLKVVSSRLDVVSSRDCLISSQGRLVSSQGRLASSQGRLVLF